MLTIRNLGKSYGGATGRRVLRNIDLDLADGEYIAITGESGIGKSTLLNLIAGLDLPDSGCIILDGADLTQLDDDARTRLRRTHMGFVFQAFHLLPHLNIEQNVGLPLLLTGASAQEIAARVHELLRAVGLSDRSSAYPRELSGGQMQRVAIVRALIHRPRLVLADEPTGNIDPEAGAEVLQLLRTQISAAGGSGILVTHSAVAAASADRVLVLSADGLRPAVPR